MLLVTIGSFVIGEISPKSEFQISKIRKSSAFGVFQSPEVRKKIVKISGFLYLAF
jgi:hypothetical protein